MIFQNKSAVQNQQHCYIVIGPLRTHASAQAQWDTPGGDTSKRNAMRYQWIAAGQNEATVFFFGFSLFSLILIGFSLIFIGFQWFSLVFIDFH